MKTPKPRTRVVFVPNPASYMMYSKPPKRGATGTITSVPLGGGRHSHFMPGPGGGLIYVDWDNEPVQGVAPQDLRPASEEFGGLITSTNNKTAERKIRQAFAAKFGKRIFPRSCDTFYEHGQWWVNHIPSGRTWSAVDSVPGVEGSGIDFERI